MNPIQQIKLALRLKADANELQEGIKMKNATKVVAAIIAALTAIVQIPSVQTGLAHFISAHPAVALTVSGIAGLLALVHNPKATASAVILALALTAGRVQAQNVLPPAPTPSAPAGFTASTGPVAINYKGAWSVGTIVDQSFDLIDFGAKKSTHLFVAGSELLAPTPGWNAYFGKVTVQPDFSRALARTNIAPSSLSVSFDGAAGVGTPTGSGSSIAWYAGGGVKYQLTSALSWQSLQAQYGAVGSQRFAALSTGLSFLFGK